MLYALIHAVISLTALNSSPWMFTVAALHCHFNTFLCFMCLCVCFNPFSLFQQLQKAIEGSTRSGVRLRPPLASFRDASRKTKKHQSSSSTPSSPTRDRDMWGEGSRMEGELVRKESKEDSRGKASSSRGAPGGDSAPSSPTSVGGTSGGSATTRGADAASQEPASPSTSSPTSSSPPASPVSPTSPVLTLSSLQEERESEESDEPI